jgi:hypothetical protein
MISAISVKDRLKSQMKRAYAFLHMPAIKIALGCIKHR